MRISGYEIFRSVLLISLVFIVAGCRDKPKTQHPQQKLVNNKLDYSVKTDIRIGRAFYSIYVNEQGNAWVAKGWGSDSQADFTEIDSVYKSKVFKIDSVTRFYETIRKMSNYTEMPPNTRGLARVEIYYNRKKIYDAINMNADFWDLYRPMLSNFPKGFSPFDSNTWIYFK